MFCHRTGKLLPMRWQAFANTVARLCQYGGKTLPMWWHNFANVVARWQMYFERETALTYFFLPSCN
jgi:hypothetical protein